MIGRIFGIGDLLTVIVLLALHFDVHFGWRFVALFACYLLIKGFMFWGDWNSWADMAIGIYMLIMFLGLHTFIDWIAIIYLLQKAFFSLVW
ncbi:MAG: hypothetical protein KJ574_03760 [Nanoarchaeota archaeon]|nr:hypothetical protein [Nanoarchaeota archaeon]